MNSDGTIQSIGGNEATNDPSTSSVNSNADDLRAALANSRTLIHGVGQALSSLR